MLPAQLISALVAAWASELATLSALQGVLTARLHIAQEGTDRDDAEDRLLTADDVAAVLGVPKRWVQRRARRLKFARLISDHAVRYSAVGLKRSGAAPKSVGRVSPFKERFARCVKRKQAWALDLSR